MSVADLRICLIHLRLGFQFLLSPIFLWGYVIAGGYPDEQLILGYLALHGFGYAGGTALNSYYDRDTGPIGGLEQPPPVPRGLLSFSLAWQLAGLLICLAVNPILSAIYVVMFCMSLAYSHPRWRFKGRPVAALATVALGQGVLACLAGWACARGELMSALSFSGLLTVGSATLLTIGLYPLTEIYQIDEDLRRGDMTLAAWLGPVGSFRLALGGLLGGGAAAAVLIVTRYQAGEAILLALFLAGVLAIIWHWSTRFDQMAILENFRMVMRLYAVTSLGFLGWIVLHLAGIL